MKLPQLASSASAAQGALPTDRPLDKVLDLSFTGAMAMASKSCSVTREDLSGGTKIWAPGAFRKDSLLREKILLPRKTRVR